MGTKNEVVKITQPIKKLEPMNAFPDVQHRLFLNCLYIYCSSPLLLLKEYYYNLKAFNRWFSSFWCCSISPIMFAIKSFTIFGGSLRCLSSFWFFLLMWNVLKFELYVKGSFVAWFKGLFVAWLRALESNICRGSNPYLKLY